MTITHRRSCMTGAGACCIWDPTAFTHITDEAAHFDALIDDYGLEETIATGRFVPINDEGDGNYDIEIRIVSDGSNPDEIKRANETSRPYRLVTSGEICVSGIEFVGHPIDVTVHRIPIPPGEFVVTIYNIDDDFDDSPQFLALLRPICGNEELEFCTHNDTFCRNPPVLPSGHVGFRVTACDNWRQLKQDTIAVTGHDKIAVSHAFKEHVPLYLGNGYQDGNRIREFVPALLNLAKSMNCSYYFVLDDQRIEPNALLNHFNESAG